MGDVADAATVLAVDIGAESGRVVAVSVEAERLTAREVHRFANVPLVVGDGLHWDVRGLWAEVETGVELGLAQKPLSVGVDTWAVDFALLDADGGLLGDPHHYRDHRTDGALDRLLQRVPRETIFAETGIQFMPINTLVQLFTMVESGDPRLRDARTFLTIPDLFNHWLAGGGPGGSPGGATDGATAYARESTRELTCEFTNATTTQLFNPTTRTWSSTLLDALGLPAELFPSVSYPGTRVGSHRGLDVVLPATHDTGSAVAAIPSAAPRDEVAFISSGTWSLVGTEVDEPLLGPAALAANVTNEGAADGGYRLLKNVMGLWVLQQCRATWAAAGMTLSYDEIVAAAAEEPALRSVIPVDHPDFLHAGDHASTIGRLCRELGEPEPTTPAAIARAVFDSLALAYAATLDQLAALTGRTFSVIHVVGGGSRNAVLNQATADATGTTVVAGPVEATAIGNALVQLRAAGVIPDLATGKRLVANGFDLQVYEPRTTGAWRTARDRAAGHALHSARRRPA